MPRALLAVVFLTLALPVAGQSPEAADPTPAGPPIDVMWAAGSPVTLSEPRLGSELGLPFVECLFANGGEADASQVEVLFLVYDSTGRRKGAHTLAVAAADLPIEAHAKRVVRLPLPSLDAGRDELVRIGLTKVVTDSAAGTWANENLAEESDAQVNELFAPPPLVVSNPEGAPVSITDVSVQADTEGRVIGISLTARSAFQAPVLGFTVVAHLIDAQGAVRRSLYQTVAPGRALLADSPYRMQLLVNGADGEGARVWVGLENTKSPAWTSTPDTRLQAREALQRRRR
jgi:hypothetical protein